MYVASPTRKSHCAGPTPPSHRIPPAYFIDKRIADSDDEDDLVFYSSFPLPERGSAVIDSGTDD